MSSAKNHKIRSHRSYKNKVSTVENFQRQQYVKAASKQVMKSKGNFFTRLMGMLKKGDK